MRNLWDDGSQVTTVHPEAPEPKPVSRARPSFFDPEPEPVAPPTAAQRRRRRWATPGVAVSTVAMLGALVAVGEVVARTGNSRPPDPNQVTSLAPVNGMSDAARLQATVDDLSHYVERARGLTFLRPVKATLLSDAEFDARLKLLGANAPDQARLTGRIATLEALGILAPDFSPGPDDTKGILGYYDPKTKTLAVRGNVTDVFVKRTLVHELTHALQDQRFDLGRMPSGEDDVGLAARSVVEGDARRIENGWVATLSPSEQDLLERQTRSRGFEAFPADHYAGYVGFPYANGSQFVNELQGRGGQALIDEAFRRFPTSSKEIVSSNLWRQHRAPIDVAAPNPGGKAVDQGQLGLIDLVYMFVSVLPSETAVPSALTWGGARYVTWQGPKGPCVQATLAAADNESAQLGSALRQWASDGNRVISGAGPFTIDACA